MGGLLPPLAALFGVELDALTQRLKENAIAYAAIALFALICLVFLLVALYTALYGWIGPIWAPLAIAGVALLIAIILLIALRIQQGAAQRREAERRREAEGSAMIASAALAALPELLQSSAVRNVALPIALYAGLLMFTGKRKPKDD